MKKSFRKKAFSAFLLVVALVLIIAIAAEFFPWKKFYIKGDKADSGNDISKSNYSSSFFPSAECEKEYDKIDADLAKANYCSTDDDCEEMPLGGPWIEFGCYHYINKNINKSDFRHRISEYDAFCDRMIDECMFAPKAVCVNSTCVEGPEEL